MNQRELMRLDRELTAYLESMLVGMGRPERRQAMADYLTGLLLDGDRKSIEPMAGRLVEDSADIQAMRQRLQQCVTVSPWSDEELLLRLALKADAELPEVEALVVDDTGFPKKGTHSVGVQRQYSGTLGRKDNCQVATSLHLASERGSVCIGMQVYLPESWTSDRARCRAVGVPDDVPFRTKWQISLAQIDAALDWGLKRRVVLADPGYGNLCRCSLWRSHWAARPARPCTGERDHAVGRAHALALHAFEPLTNTCTAKLQAMNSGSCTSGPLRKKSRRNSGFRPCHTIRRSNNSCVWQSCDGASSVTTKS